MINNNVIHNRIVGLDIMRGLALIMIFASHSLCLFERVFPQLMPLANFFRDGIEVYFSLSGFLIGDILFRKFDKLKDVRAQLFSFYKRRWIRTIPLYYLGIIINLLSGFFITGNYFDFNWTFLVFLQNVTEAGFWFFPISYSLSIEEWFYLIFPLMLIPACYVFSKNTIVATVILSLVFIIIATCIRYHLYISSNPHWDANMRKTIISRIDASMYGVLMAAFYNGYKHVFHKNRNRLIVTGIVFYCVATYIHMRLPDTALNYVWFFNLVPLAFALSIPWFYNFSFKQLPLNKLFTWLSYISLAFYIIHLNPVMELIVFFIPTNTWPDVIKAFTIFTASSILLAYLLHVYIEKPIMNLVKR